MAYEVKDMSGSLFINDKREKDTHPNWTGSGKINGKDVWISAWVKQTKNGQDWLSLSFKEKDAVHSAGVAKVTKAIEKPIESAWDDTTDSIPF